MPADASRRHPPTAPAKPTPKVDREGHSPPDHKADEMNRDGRAHMFRPPRPPSPGFPASAEIVGERACARAESIRARRPRQTERQNNRPTALTLWGDCPRAIIRAA